MWSSAGNPTSCTAVGEWNNSPMFAGSGLSNALLTSTKTFSFYCSNAGGQGVTSSATVNICPVGNKTWNGSSCVNITGAINPNTCTIAAESSSCAMDVTWSSSNTMGAVTIQKPYDSNNVLAGGVGPSGTVQATFPKGTYELDLYDGTTQLGLATFAATCAAGTTWDGSVCLTNVTIGSFTLTDTLVNANSSTNLNWGGVTVNGRVGTLLCPRGAVV